MQLDPKDLAQAIAAGMEAAMRQKEAQRKQHGEFLASMLLPNEHPRDEQGRFADKESTDAEAK
jgi:hypothetical protein